MAVTITVDEMPEKMPDPEMMAGWVSDIAFEGTATSDGRYILPDALAWRDPPLTLMAMTETGPGGHEGAFVAGRIDSFMRDTDTDMDGNPLPDGVTAIRSTGIFDTGENGVDVARMVADEILRGVSIDMSVDEWVFRDPATGEIVEPDEADETDMERAFFGELQLAVRRGEIMAATVCPTPAFADARIALTAGAGRVMRIWAPIQLGAVRETVTASAAGLAPVLPPSEWFYELEHDAPTPLTVTDRGQVYGHVALWDACHIGIQGGCFNPPRSQSGYSHFNLGEIQTADRKRVRCGQITMATDHAPLNTNDKGARRHYEDTGFAGADVRAVDGRYGIWVAGGLRPKITVAQAREFMGAKPSGDWRQIKPGGPLEMVGLHMVNTPGFPVVRPEARLVASAAGDVEVAALVGTMVEDEIPEAPALLERRLDLLAARAEGIDALAELAGV